MFGFLLNKRSINVVGTPLTVEMIEKQGVTLDRYLADCDKAIVALKGAIRDTNNFKRNKLKELNKKILFRGSIEKEVADLEFQALTLADQLAEIKRYKSEARRTIKRYEAEAEKRRDARELRRASKSRPVAKFCVYQVALADEIYIGITNDFGRRFKQHINNSHNEGVRSMIRRGAKPVIRFEGLTVAEARGIESGLIRAARVEGKLVHNQTGFFE